MMKEARIMTPNEYIGFQQNSRKWQAFLYSMARELEGNMNQDQLVQFMRGVGERMAEGFPDEGLDSLNDVETMLNDGWKESDWGWVQITDEQNIVNIEHYYAPLKENFGETALPWSAALLEGFYSKVFHQLGAGLEMAVRQKSAKTTDEKISLALAVI